MILPDVLKPDLDVVFVGTAAGTRSARDGIYYAHPGNKFWRTLKDVGLLPPEFQPSEFRRVVAHGIGLTDMCKIRAGSDAEIGNDAYDRDRFERVILGVKPRAIAFTSKKAASVWLRQPTGKIVLGQQAARDDGFPTAFVLPSPSGLATGYWDERYWRALAEWVRARRSKNKSGAS